MMFEKFKQDLSVVFERYPAARSYLEILTTYPGVHAILFHRVAHKIWKIKLFWLGRLISHISRLLTGIEIHPGAVIGSRFFIDHGMGVVIGETAVVGDNVSMLHSVTLGGTGKEDEIRHPNIGDGVLLGAGAKVLGNISVGSCSRVAAGSVVLQNVPEKSTVAGVPAKVVGAAGCTNPSISMDQIIKRK